MSIVLRLPAVVIFASPGARFALYEECMCPGCDPDAKIVLGVALTDQGDDIVAARLPCGVPGDWAWSGYAAA